MSFRLFGAGILEGAVTVGCTLWSGYAGACAGCCCMLLLKWRALSECFGGGLLVLEGSAAGCASAGCWCRVLLQGAVRVGVRASELLQGVAGRYRCRVLLQGAAPGTACWCRCKVVRRFGAGCRVLLSECGVRYEAWVLVSLQGVAARCLWQCGRWARMEIMSMP